MYDAEKLRRQTVLHLLKNMEFFSEDLVAFLQNPLEPTDDPLTYIILMWKGLIWGDQFMASVVGHMWNISISICLPGSTELLHLFHKHQNPDIVIVGNGWGLDDPRSAKQDNPRACTHFVATSEYKYSSIVFKLFSVDVMFYHMSILISYSTYYVNSNYSVIIP